MATPDDGLSAVVALTNKANDLNHAGHRERSIEYAQRALVAAQSLGAQDCLIVVRLQMRLFSAAFQKTLQLSEQRELAAPSELATALSLFFNAVATLQRRRATGTLLAGCCRAAEVTYEQRTCEHAATHHSGSVLSAAVAPHFGYDAFLKAAAHGSNVLIISATGIASVTQEQLRDCLILMTGAAELMMLPRSNELVFFGCEGLFTSGMQNLVDCREALVPQGADGARLVDTWRRVQQSGVLQRRGVGVAMQAHVSHHKAQHSAAVAAGAAPGLRNCGLAGCGAREQHPSHFKSCAACRGVAYCSKAHQIEHWPSHKAACKAARKAAEKEAQK